MLGPSPAAPCHSHHPGGRKSCLSPVPQPPRWKEAGPRADILLLPSKAALGTLLRIPSTRALGCILQNSLPSKIKGVLNIHGGHFGLILSGPRCSVTPLTEAGSWRQGEALGAEPHLIAIKAAPAKSSGAGIFHGSLAKITEKKIHS